MANLRIAVIGCTLSTMRCMEEIIRSGDTVAGLITLAQSKSAAKARYMNLDIYAEENNIPVFHAEKTNDPATISFLQGLNADLLLEVGWSHWIGKEILSAPKMGTIGLHNSYLPKNQGAASINWALIRDEKEWGVTLFWLAENIDAGDIIAQRMYPITDDDDVMSLFDKADAASVEMLKEALPLLREGKAPRITQNPADVTSLPRRKPEDGKIDWNKPAREIWNLIRALKKPYPNAFTSFQGEVVAVGNAQIGDRDSQGPGVIQEILETGILVGTGQGTVLLTEVEPVPFGIAVSQKFDV